MNYFKLVYYSIQKLNFWIKIRYIDSGLITDPVGCFIPDQYGESCDKYLRKRTKAPLTSDSKACPAKRSMTQPSRLTQSQLSMNPATTATTSGSVDTSASSRYG